jgi:predicted acetyltransferase
VTHEPRILRADEARASVDLFLRALLHAPVSDEHWAFVAADLAPGRSWGVHAGSELVATGRSFATRTAVPGGAVLDVGAVTQIAVRADHTRRGLLTAVMRALLGDLAERGETLAVLRATEARIYGRFGYGVATRSRSLSVRARRGWRPALPCGEVRMIEPARAVDVLHPVHERLALARPGGIERPAVWWQRGLGRSVREGKPLLVAVHIPDGGSPADADGFAVAEAHDGALRLQDLHATTPGAHAALWRFLLGVDLVSEVTAWSRPRDEPLDLLLADARELSVTGEADELWLRLVDVPAALAARTFAPAPPVLLAVHDPFLPDNAGVYRIAGGTAERVAPLGGPVAADLECDVAALAMAYLGDRRPSQLCAAGWWTAHDLDAVARADATFATDAVPWCGTMF